MPRQLRIDAQGALHHVMIRGIERTAIFRNDRDRWRTWSSKNLFTQVSHDWEVRVFDSFGCMMIRARLPVRTSDEVRIDPASGWFSPQSAYEAVILSKDPHRMGLLRSNLLGRSIEDIERRNEKGDTLLLMAVRMNNEVAAKDLLNLGASPYVWDVAGKTPYDLAKANGNRKLFQLLPKIGPKTTLPTSTYAYTVWTGFNLLIRAWAPVNRLETFLKATPDYFEGKNRRTNIRGALITAVKYGNIGAMQFLSKNVDQIDRIRDLNMSLIDIAVEHEQSAAAAYLGRLGADLNKLNINGVLPLSKAVTKGNWRLVEGRLSGGADPNADSGNSSRPLTIAVNNGQIIIARLLLDAGADPTAANKKGQTAADMVCRHPHISWPPDLLRRLQVKGGCP